MKTRELSSSRNPDGFEVLDECLYSYTTGTQVGVLLDEQTMRKIAKLQALHMQDVKRTLLKAAEEGRVAHGMWTLHHPEGEQTSVQYIDRVQNPDALARRIKAAQHSQGPKCLDLIFVADSMDDAKIQADRHHEHWKEARSVRRLEG